MTRSKNARSEMLRKLKQEIRKAQAAEVIEVGDFNEDTCSKNMQEFMA